jgi:exodeoxyribonuclease-5
MPNKDKTYVQLSFCKIRKYGGKYVLTKSNTLDNETYEEIVSPEFTPKNLVEFYLKTMIESPMTELPMEIPPLTLLSTIKKAIVDKIEDKSRSLYFDSSSVRETFESVMREVNSSADVFKISPDTEEITYSYLKTGFTTESESGLRAFTSMLKDAEFIISKLRTYTADSLTIFSGGPGCGKTHRCIQDIKDKGYKCVLVTSLSNIVGLRFLKRLQIKGSEQWSFTKVGFSRASMLEKFDSIVIEEASMVSSSEFAAIKKLVGTGKPLYFLGDPDQLPGFTGLGNLFSTLIKEFPAYSQILTKQHRMTPELMKIVSSVKTTGCLPYCSPEDSKKAIHQYIDWVHRGLSAMAITYMNSDCVTLNDLVISTFGIEAKYQLTKQGTIDTESWKAVLHEAAAKSFKLKVVSIKNLTKRSVAPSGKESYTRLVSNGEQGTLKYIGDDQYEFESAETETTQVFKELDVLFNFRLGYALTIHKAQGSEWDYVYYYEPAIHRHSNYPLNLRYVAVTRAKQKFVWKAANNPRLSFLKFNHILTNK